MEQPPRIQRIALNVTRWVGSPQSILTHTIIFSLSFLLVLLEVLPLDTILLILNTIVSLEAIYLALFIQLTVNYTSRSLEEVEHDIDEIQSDVDEIQEDIDEIQEDVGEIQEDVDELNEEEKEEYTHLQDDISLAGVRAALQKLLKDIEHLEHPSA